MSNVVSEVSVAENSQGYFYTDWSAMTTQDWAGLLMTLVTFVLMAIAYFYVFRPKNKEILEEQKYLFEADKTSNTEKK